MHRMRVIAFTFFALFASELYAEQITPCFTPQQNCTHAIVRVLDQAEKEILVQAYSFTSKDIADALLRAHKRGVRVRLLLDKSQRTDQHSRSPHLTHAGMDVRIDEVPGIAHNKVMIIDEYVVITGSFNFTQAAQFRNSENVVFIESAEIAQQYKQNWVERAQQAKPYTIKVLHPKPKHHTKQINNKREKKHKSVELHKPHVKTMRKLFKHLKEAE